MTQTEAVAQFLRTMSTVYLLEQQAKGLYASGRSARSLKEVTDPDGGRLFGKGYFHFQKVGRRPGRFPPIDAILNWIHDKGIHADIPENSLAFLIARKIARSGTDIFQRKRSGLNIKDELVDARKELVANISRIRKEQMIQKLKGAAIAKT